MRIHSHLLGCKHVTNLRSQLEKTFDQGFLVFYSPVISKTSTQVFSRWTPLCLLEGKRKASYRGRKLGQPYAQGVHMVKLARLVQQK